MIKYWDEFWIDVDLFKELSNPTPFVQIGGLNFKADRVSLALEHIHKGYSIQEKAFKFSNTTTEILKAKMEGTYQIPNWKPVDGPDNITDLCIFTE